MAADSPLSSDSSADDISAFSSINVTPFVDVVLVLLVIFMVTAPLLAKDIMGINLPKAKNGEQKILKSLGVAVTANGQFLLNGQLISPDALVDSARQAFSENQEIQALISADGEARHTDVVRAIDLIRTAGIVRFALQVEKP